MNLSSAVKAKLRWFVRNPSLPTSPKDRQIRRLAYDTGQELGLVCERSNGTFWCFVTSCSISTLPVSIHLRTYKTPDSAAAVLEQHVVSELLRIYRLETCVPEPAKLKIRDKAASNGYDKVSFKAGASWILESEGFPRRPQWAKFLIQNADGRFVWFEYKPTLISGSWKAEGRSQPVVLSDRLSSCIVSLSG